MKRIDRETTQKILDAADIVEVVSDFVSLKRRGANYIGLCPFHNERTPSFSVSKSKGICKCFSCGKGGSAVNFIMELEQLSFTEALRYLAKKYNIEIKEQELTEEERKQDMERSNMLAVNDYALKHFVHNIEDTDEGKDIGLSYFRERGINDAAIKRFSLGYALNDRTALFDAAVKDGYNPEYLAKTGVCIYTDDNRYYDRFRGRVIYPIFSISGKVLGFGGRTLRSDKQVAKYVNSPESSIYNKSKELYGLFQAKQSIAKKNKCILVEGYMDVISMSQTGIENVVASSGTSLTDGQIRLIHRFTENVTVIYDSDAAGIKASLRGIDMLLAQGLNIKVVLLPDGDDPDSFAQSHSATEVEQYIADNETDFIAFKTKILLEGTANDPIKRAKVITDIVNSIAIIPDEITRTVYISECSRSLDINEKILTQQVAKQITKQRISDKEKGIKAASEKEIDTIEASEAAKQTQHHTSAAPAVAPQTESAKSYFEPYEREIVRYALKYGALRVSDLSGAGVISDDLILSFITGELEYHGISMLNPDFAELLTACSAQLDKFWVEDYNAFKINLDEKLSTSRAIGEQEIKNQAQTLDQIKLMTDQLDIKLKNEADTAENDYRTTYLIKALTSSDNDTVRHTATELATSRHKLSKVHSKYVKLETEQDKLSVLLQQAIYGIISAKASYEIKEKRLKLKQISQTDIEMMMVLMREIQQLEKVRRSYAKFLGERVISPR